jgi:hypothetical protein
MSKFRFRALIVFSVIFAFTGAGYDLVYPDPFIESINDFIFENEPTTSETFDNAVLALISIVLILTVVAYVGLFLFKRWGVYLYAFTLLISCIFYFSDGAYVFSSFGQFNYDVSIFLSGVILTLVIFSPVKHYFDAHKT